MARQILRKVLEGRLVFEPREDEDGARFYTVTEEGTLARAISGTVLATAMVTPAGFSERWGFRLTGEAVA